ncbi:hypothetical protein DXW36_21850 [Salmonella enterica]|nr:hypothetical protein [Salmonella enterica]
MAGGSLSLTAKKTLQRSQYRKAVEAHSSQKKVFQNCLTCLHQLKHMLQNFGHKSETYKRNLTTVIR